MGRFGKIKETKITERGIYFLPGLHTVRVKCVKAFETRQKVNAVVIEAEVLKTTSSIPLGTVCTQYIDLGKDAGMPNFKQFAMVAFGVKEEEVDEEAAEMIVSEKQPAAGKVLALQCSTATSQKTKQEYTRHWWLSETEAAKAA